MCHICGLQRPLLMLLLCIVILLSVNLLLILNLFKKNYSYRYAGHLNIIKENYPKIIGVT